MFMAGGETAPANTDRASMTMNWMLLNITLGLAMVAIAVGLPAWVLWKFPDEDGRKTTTQRAALRQATVERSTGGSSPSWKSPRSLPLTVPAQATVRWLARENSD
jgi:hypothetical protein